MCLCLLEMLSTLSTLRLQLSNPVEVHGYCEGNGVVSSPRRLKLRIPTRRHFASFTVSSVEKASSEPLISSQLTSTIGSSSYSTLTHRYIQFLSFTACTAASSAIPALQAFKRAAESLEKLMDVTREELPGTMAAVRISGMEISDLTVEISDLGQQINRGVRRSTRAVRLAEERLRRLANMKPIGGSPNKSPDSRASSS